MHPWDELEVVRCLLMLDLIKKKYMPLGRKHLGHSFKFPPKNKRGNHNKKKPYSYVSVVANLPSLLYLFFQDSIQFLLCFVCLLFQLSKKLWKKVQFEPVKILFFSLDVKLISSGFENKLDSISHAKKSGSGVMHTALTWFQNKDYKFFSMFYINNCILEKENTCIEKVTTYN